MSRVTCSMSRVTCHVSHDTCHMSHLVFVFLLLVNIIFFDKRVKLVSGGSVINGAYPVELFSGITYSLQRSPGHPVP